MKMRSGLVFLILLAGCGSDDYDDPPPPAPVVVLNVETKPIRAYRD